MKYVCTNTKIQQEMQDLNFHSHAPAECITDNARLHHPLPLLILPLGGGHPDLA
jgi:hypothetical protein